MVLRQRPVDAGARFPMSDSANPKSHRFGLSGSSTMSDGLTPATARQVARLRFLGVRFHEPLSMGQAGTLIDRANANPALAARIEEWHARKFELYPALYRALPTAAAVPTRQAPGTKFQLPARGHGEANATIFQKRRLEQFGGCDFPVIDALGREQAAALINFLEAEAVARSREFLQAQIEARSQETGPAGASPQTWQQAPGSASQRSAHSRWIVWGLPGVAAAGLGLFFLYRTPVTPATTAPAERVPAPVAALATTDPAALAAARFKQALAASRGRALMKYPALGIAGSRFNSAFLARYQQISKQHSARLNSPDWPEKLADECAAKLPAAAR